MPSETVQAVNNFETNSRRSQEVGETRTSRGRRESTGRYADVRSTRAPANGLGRAVPSLNMRTSVGAVIDPMGNGIERIQATINRRVDILENERSHKRISEAAYRVGRQVQETFEKLGALSGSSLASGGGGTGNPKAASDHVAAKSVDAARQIQALLQRMAARIGMIDSRLLRQVIGDRLTFAECAALRGKGSGSNAVAYIGARFREALEDLALAWTAKGVMQAIVDDQHFEASHDAVARQRSSIEAGVTVERRRREADEAKRQASDTARRLREGSAARRR